MSQSELLTKVVTALDAASVPYMLTGSYASSLQGEPRSTHDIGLVVHLREESIAIFVNRFSSPDYYLSEDAIIDAIARESHFNLIDVTTGDKVDFWMLTDEPFDQSRFARRYPELLFDQTVYVSRPEDTIIMKLRWCQLLGGSVKQLSDAQGVYELQRGQLDEAYIIRWAASLGVEDLWKQILTEADDDLC